MIDALTACVALFGNPVAHSLSPQMHNAAFKHLGLNMIYLAFQVERAADAAAAMRACGFHGASVTVPHKEAMLVHLDEIDEASRTIGAVNTIINRQGRLVAGNTDWLGVVRSLEQATELAGKRCLILGAGGAARAAVYGLGRAGVQVFLTNRTEVRGRRLADDLQCTFVHWHSWEHLEVDLLVNATTVGMGTGQSPVPRKWLRSGMVVMDMVYRPPRTRLLRDAEEAGCQAISGLDMLLYQGAAQLELWTCRRAPLEIMRRALMEGLGHETDQNR
ncbi:MAG: shikimate dehydrogenase [Syntrophobacteria bacterium]